MKKLLLLAIFVVGLAFPACASGSGYVKLSLWDNLSFAIPNNTQEIRGVDLGIGSHTRDVIGLQWDVIWAETHYLTGASLAWGMSKTSQAEGLQWAFVTTADKITGAQLGLVNTSANTTGAQVGGLNMSLRSIVGAQVGGANMALRSVTGAQVGAVNISLRSVVGAQVGFYNRAEHITGAQLGFVNYARSIRGLQVGIFNIAENGYLPAMIFVNGRF